MVSPDLLDNLHWFLSLLNVNIELDSLWTHLEAISLSLSPQHKRTLNGLDSEQQVATNYPEYKTQQKAAHVYAEHTAHLRTSRVAWTSQVTSSVFYLHNFFTLHLMIKIAFP